MEYRYIKKMPPFVGGIQITYFYYESLIIHGIFRTFFLTSMFGGAASRTGIYFVSPLTVFAMISSCSSTNRFKSSIGLYYFCGFVESK